MYTLYIFALRRCLVRLGRENPPRADGAETGNRTRDLILTMDALCRLSYLGFVGGSHAQRGEAHVYLSDINNPCHVIRRGRKRDIVISRLPSALGGGSLRYYVVLGEGFEPPESVRTSVLQTDAIDHSATPACSSGLIIPYW